MFKAPGLDFCIGGCYNGPVGVSLHGSMLTVSTEYLPEETRISIDTAPWHETDASGLTLSPAPASQQAATESQRRTSGQRSGASSTRASSTSGRHSNSSRRWPGGMNAILMAASVAILLFVFMSRGGPKVVSAPSKESLPSTQEGDVDLWRSARFRAEEYARSIDVEALWHLPIAARGIGVSLHYSLAADETALLTRQARAIDVQRSAVLRLQEQISEGRFTEAEAESYASQALQSLQENVEDIVNTAVGMHMNAYSRACDLAARVESVVASLRAHRDTASNITEERVAPYVKLQQYVLSRWCMAAEREAANVQRDLVEMKQLHEQPAKCLTDAGKVLSRTELLSKRMAFIASQLDAMEASGTESLSVLRQGLHVTKCLQASVAVHSLRPHACRLRVKHAKAMAVAEHLTVEEQQQLERCGDGIDRAYDVFDKLEQVVASINLQEDPSTAPEDLNAVTSMREQLELSMKQLEAQIDDLMQTAPVTPEEKFNAADGVLMLQDTEARTCLSYLRFLAKFGERWGREVHSVLAKASAKGPPTALVSFYAKRATEMSTELTIALQAGEQLFSEFGSATSLVEAAQMYQRLYVHLMEVENWMLRFVEDVATATACEALSRAVRRAENSILQTAAALDSAVGNVESTVLLPAAEDSLLLPAAEDSLLKNMVKMFSSTEDVMLAGSLTLDLMELALKLEAARIELDAKGAREEAMKYLVPSGGQTL